MMTVEVTDTSFAGEVGASPVPIVLEFYANWCGNCRKVAPVLEALADEFDARVRLLRVNAEGSPDLAARFSVSSTPTLVALEGGREMARVVGAQRAAVLRELFTAATGVAGKRARPSWVPAESCTLPTADQPLRLAEFDELFSTAVRAVDRRSPTWLRLRLSDAEGLEVRTRDLVARETDCCDFFDFSVHRAAEETVLDVRVPAGRAVVLDGLAEQAATAGARR